METQGLTHWADILIVVVYFVVVLGIGLLVSSSFTEHVCQLKHIENNIYYAFRKMRQF